MSFSELCQKDVSEKLLYYPEGQLYARLHFAKGVREGVQRYFYPSGALKTSETYSQGLLEGEVYLHWPNGRLKRQCRFARGKREGLDRIWSEEGQLLDEGFYEQGIPKGVHRRWSVNGHLIEEVEHLREKKGIETPCAVEPALLTTEKIAFAPACYRTNLSLLMERFPRLGLLVPTFAMEEPRSESLLCAPHQTAQAIYVYGLGGEVPYAELKPWLSADPERLLIFLEDEPGQLAAFLSSSGAFEILSDPQVEIEYGPFSSEALDSLVDRFPFERIEVIALPSKRTPQFTDLRLELLRKSALAHAIHTDRLHGYQPFHNFIKNLPHLSQSFYANRLKGAFSGIPAIVCGAGPSLNRAAPLLKTVEDKALLIAGGSTLAALSAQGVLPHFGMAIDPNLEEYRRLKNSFAFEVPLLYSTRVFPAIFQICNSPLGYLRSGMGGMNELWIEEKLGLNDPLMGEHLSHESISVTAICLAWAQFLGCDPIFLSGVDLAYTQKKRYADGVLDFSSNELCDEGSAAADRFVEKKNRRGETIISAVRWTMEAASLSHLAKHHLEVRFFNTSDEGLDLEAIPFIPLEEAIEKHLTAQYDLRTLVQGQIIEASMPAQTKQIIEREMSAIQESLKRVIDYLEVLAGQRAGSKALAEVELGEEAAYTFFFYDAEAILQRPIRSFPNRAIPSEKKWERLAILAKKYEAIFATLHQDRSHIREACCAASSH